MTRRLSSPSRSKFQRHSVRMAQNGSANASIEAPLSSSPTVVGINYGNSYASIAVVSKARVHFFAARSQVIAHSSCRKDLQTVLPTRMVNARLPPLSPSMARKPYACLCPRQFLDLKMKRDTVYWHWRKTSAGEKPREHDHRLQKSPR